MPQKRKKWTEVEEKTLIEKYGEMVSDGTLVKIKTRKKKYKPIALHVNSTLHIRDPIAYPWQWTWKDVSTKVQNMRHQYLLVKENGGGLLGGVKGMEMAEFGQLGNSTDGDFAGIDGGENGVLGLGFDYEGEEAEKNCNGNDRVRDDGDDGFMYEEVEPNVSNLRKIRKALKGFQKKGV
ncbi:hypothetical protein D5086_002798 [Populus alba]|uniref:Uncharacterized protein n=1 Tax=Populus alba TaxID=43335 RepID=A0ACC4D3Q3_POPAL